MLHFKIKKEEKKTLWDFYVWSIASIPWKELTNRNIILFNFLEENMSKVWLKLQPIYGSVLISIHKCVTVQQCIFDLVIPGIHTAEQAIDTLLHEIQGLFHERGLKNLHKKPPSLQRIDLFLSSDDIELQLYNMGLLLYNISER